MGKKNFLLVSLEEKKAQQLAEVINNKTSRKIINYLSEHDDATESTLSKKLVVPISTIHYNLQKLKEAQLVTVDEFHYSKKGREVDHYKLANKYVIITPKPVKGITQALKNILPAALGIVGASAILHFTTSSKNISSVPMIAAESAFAKTAQVSDSATTFVSEPSLALWFLIGGLSALLCYALTIIIKSKFEK